jgi:hypothetical protein
MIFRRFLQEAHQNFFVKHENIKDVKAMLADQYLFELYQLREFIEAGSSQMVWRRQIDSVPLSSILKLSDQVVYSIINNMTEKEMTPHY